jgi:threonine/homoserine/homoserine lactone efflux protein
MLTLMTNAVGFGFAAGTSFGPLHSILINTTLTLGWRQGILIALSPLITDAPIILLMLFVLKQMPPDAIRVIQILGGLAVLWIAYKSWRQLQKTTEEVANIPPQNLSRQTLLKGVTVNFLNPGPYIFWGTITGPMLLKGLEQSVFHGASFLISFYITLIGIMLAFVFIFDRLRGVNPRFTRMLATAAVFILVALGLQILYNGLVL